MQILWCLVHCEELQHHSDIFEDRRDFRLAWNMLWAAFLGAISDAKFSDTDVLPCIVSEIFDKVAEAKEKGVHHTVYFPSRFTDLSAQLCFAPTCPVNQIILLAIQSHPRWRVIRDIHTPSVRGLAETAPPMSQEETMQAGTTSGGRSGSRRLRMAAVIQGWRAMNAIKSGPLSPMTRKEPRTAEPGSPLSAVLEDRSVSGVDSMA